MPPWARAKDARRSRVLVHEKNGAMKLRLPCLPVQVRAAYEAWAAEPRESLSLEKFAAPAEIEAVAVAAHPQTKASR